MKPGAHDPDPWPCFGDCLLAFGAVRAQMLGWLSSVFQRIDFKIWVFTCCLMYPTPCYSLHKCIIYLMMRESTSAPWHTHAQVWAKRPHYLSQRHSKSTRSAGWSDLSKPLANPELLTELKSQSQPSCCLPLLSEETRQIKQSLLKPVAWLGTADSRLRLSV